MSGVPQCAKDMSGSKHRQMLSQEVLSVLDSLSSDRCSQTDERQALVLAFEAMHGELSVNNNCSVQAYTMTQNDVCVNMLLMPSLIDKGPRQAHESRKHYFKNTYSYIIHYTTSMLYNQGSIVESNWLATMLPW